MENMNKKTDMEKVKEMAELFLLTEPKESEFGAMIISHPFYNSGYLMVDREVKNVIEDMEARKTVTEQYLKRIRERNDYLSLISLITKPYRMDFFRHTKEYLSQEDCGKALVFVWQSTEGTNINKYISLSEKQKWFQELPREYLMTKEEMDIFEKMDEEIYIYRGLGSPDSKIKALSWTLNKDQAIWFANRWNCPQGIFQAKVKKEDVLVYFTYEEEIIVNYHKLEHIEKIG